MQFYGYVRLDPCICDYPEEGCSADIYVGNDEINCSIKLPTKQTKEVSFKINRLRSWQVAFLVSTSLTLCLNSLSLHENYGCQGRADLGVYFKSLPSAHVPLQTYPETYSLGNSKPSRLTLLCFLPSLAFHVILYLPLSCRR